MGFHFQPPQQQEGEALSTANSYSVPKSKLPLNHTSRSASSLHQGRRARPALSMKKVGQNYYVKKKKIMILEVLL